jgi:hypothetical protein
VNLDVALSLANMGLTTSLVAVMASKRILRTLPLFFTYLCFDLGCGVAGLAIYHASGYSTFYLRFFFVTAVVDFLFYFCVLAEICKNLLRFNRESRPHWDLAGWSLLGASVLVFTLSRWADAPGRSPLSNIYFLVMRIDEHLQFAGFLALITWSALRKFRWPDREFHVATGLGFTVFIVFLVSLLHSQWSSGPVYHALDQAAQAADSMTMAYWLYYFWIVDRGVPARQAEKEIAEQPR